ncbi:tetratricopeptide repeat-containing sensor histidine kinase [Flavobacterium rhizosphaerae]|uniref:Oxygen sensor histidine kinase NreB n=1 Tax=Flavobacterium rhizosphaerae TaxID=3163298 RepID=A0ABW8YYD5_9FLAO
MKGNSTNTIAFAILKRFLFFILIICAISCQHEPLDQDKLNALFEIAEDNSISADVREKYLDSVSDILSRQKNDSLTRLNYNRVASDYYSIRQQDKTLRASKNAIELAREVNDTLNLANAYYISGIIYYETAQNDSAYIYYNDAERYYRQLGIMDNLGGVILYKAYILYNINEYVLCETEAFKALALLKKENKVVEVYHCLNLIATALNGQNNYEEAIDYFEQALDQLDKFKSAGYPDNYITSYRISCYNNIGWVYQKMEKYDKAIDVFSGQLKNNNNLRQNYPALYAKVISNLAYAKFKRGDRTGVESMLKEGLKINDSLDNVSGIIGNRQSLGEYYLAKKDTVHALDYLVSSYKLASKTKRHEDALLSLRFLTDADKKNSLQYSDLYIRLNDSIQEKAKQNKNKFARIEYETERLLHEKEVLAKKNSFIIGVSVVVLLFIAAIFIIYYLNSRNKELVLMQEQQKANEEIYQLMFEQQAKIDAARAEEKNRIAMELHDGILNNIYAVRLNLEFINKKSDDASIQLRKEYIKQLQGVEAEIRGVSHELNRNSILYDDKGFDLLLGFMITSQKNKFNTQFEAIVDEVINWDDLSNLYKVNIYRIIQESLQNINKYSQAKNATVRILKDGANIHIIISDDGVGFDTEKARSGIGLKNLQSRADALKGTLHIKSTPGNGTIIEVFLPL